MNTRKPLLIHDDSSEVKGGTHNKENKNFFEVKSSSQAAIQERTKSQNSNIYEEAKIMLRDKLRKNHLSNK